MPDAPVIARFARHLVEQGCPGRRVRGWVRELTDHREDLKNAALEEGLSEDAAEARADEQLGEPAALAECLAAVFRNASWWGRHPIIGFCLLPPLALLTAVVLALSVTALAGHFYFNPDEIRTLSETGAGVDQVKGMFQGAYLIVIALTALLFCWLARRSASGTKWAVIACVTCSVHGLFYTLGIQPRSLMMGYRFPPHAESLPVVLVPLAVAVAALAWHWGRKWILAPNVPPGGTMPRPADPEARRKLARLHPPRARFLTPSSVIAAVLIAGLALLIARGWSDIRKQWKAHAEQMANLNAGIWPREHTAALERIRARQEPPPSFQGTTIDLKRHVNLPLTESLNHAAVTNANNLAELPQGIHPFAGVPFDVAGSVQLMGRRLVGSDRFFPVRAPNIVIGRKCQRIHVLHGASFLDEEMRGTRVAGLVLHYADGSQQELPIIAGQQVLDWWGPISEKETTTPGTELAWAGSNPRIRVQQPGNSLRLYRTSFENPQPQQEIVSIEYVSALTDASPFLAGLTVE